MIYKVFMALLLTVAVTVIAHFNGVHAFHTENFLPNVVFLITAVTFTVMIIMLDEFRSKVPKKYR